MWTARARSNSPKTESSHRQPLLSLVICLLAFFISLLLFFWASLVTARGEGKWPVAEQPGWLETAAAAAGSPRFACWLLFLFSHWGLFQKREKKTILKTETN